MIKPRLNCLDTRSTNFSCSSKICCLSGSTTISDTPTVIPALDENLNPKSFMRSSIIDVSVMLNLLNTSAIILPKNFLLKGAVSSCSSK